MFIKSQGIYYLIVVALMVASQEAFAQGAYQNFSAKFTKAKVFECDVSKIKSRESENWLIRPDYDTSRCVCVKGEPRPAFEETKLGDLIATIDIVIVSFKNSYSQIRELTPFYEKFVAKGSGVEKDRKILYFYDNAPREITNSEGLLAIKNNIYVYDANHVNAAKLRAFDQQFTQDIDTYYDLLKQKYVNDQGYLKDDLFQAYKDELIQRYISTSTDLFKTDKLSIQEIRESSYSQLSDKYKNLYPNLDNLFLMGRETYFTDSVVENIEFWKNESGLDPEMAETFNAYITRAISKFAQKVREKKRVVFEKS